MTKYKDKVYIDSLKITVSWLSRMIKPGIAPKAFMLSDFKHTMQTMELIIERYRAYYSCLSLTHLNVHMDKDSIHVNVCYIQS